MKDIMELCLGALTLALALSGAINIIWYLFNGTDIIFFRFIAVDTFLGILLGVVSVIYYTTYIMKKDSHE